MVYSWVKLITINYYHMSKQYNYYTAVGSIDIIFR